MAVKAALVILGLVVVGLVFGLELSDVGDAFMWGLAVGLSASVPAAIIACRR